MQWSVLILRMLEEGNTPEQIIQYIDNPIVTRSYIKKLIRFRARARKKHWNSKPVFHFDPVPGDWLYPVHEQMLTMGSKEVFAKAYKENGPLKLAKAFGVTKNHVLNYYHRVIKGYTNHRTPFKDLEDQRRWVTQRKKQRVPNKDLKGLF
jgi:hypothetical protein